MSYFLLLFPVPGVAFSAHHPEMFRQTLIAFVALPLVAFVALTLFAFVAFLQKKSDSVMFLLDCLFQFENKKYSTKKKHISTQIHHTHHLPCTNSNTRSTPDHSDPIYAITTCSRRFQKGATSCSVNKRSKLINKVKKQSPQN